MRFTTSRRKYRGDCRGASNEILQGIHHNATLVAIGMGRYFVGCAAAMTKSNIVDSERTGGNLTEQDAEKYKGELIKKMQKIREDCFVAAIEKHFGTLTDPDR